MQIKNSLLLLFFLFNILIVTSQQEKVISFEEVLSNVEKNNHTIKISEQDYSIAKADYSQTNSVFLPNVTISHTAMAITNPLMAFGSKLNQEILRNIIINLEIENQKNVNNIRRKLY